jgi:drug/metabolite transporter (DMT)-like permease
MATTAPPDRMLAGIALRVGAAATYALMASLLKLAGERGVIAPEMVFYRAMFGIPIVLAWVLLGPGLSSLRPVRPSAHLARSILGAVSILATFQALIMLPLAAAITIGFTAPIFATLLSAAILREPVGLRRWTAVALGFAGIVIATRPGEVALPLLGIAVAVFSALGQGSVTVTLRHLGRTENPASIVFWFFAFCTLCGGIGLPFYGRVHDATTFALLVAGGTAGGAMQLMMTAALRLAPVSVVAPFDYSQILWAVLLGWTIWGTAPDWATLAGAALIAASGLYTAFREHRLRIRAAPPVPVD